MRWRAERAGKRGKFRRGAVETIKAQHVERRRCVRDRAGDGGKARAPVCGVEQRRVERGIRAARRPEQHMRFELPRRFALAHDERRERTAGAQRRHRCAACRHRGPRSRASRVPRDAVEETRRTRRAKKAATGSGSDSKLDRRLRRWRRPAPRPGGNRPLRFCRPAHLRSAWFSQKTGIIISEPAPSRRNRVSDNSRGQKSRTRIMAARARIDARRSAATRFSPFRSSSKISPQNSPDAPALLSDEKVWSFRELAAA